MIAVLSLSAWLLVIWLDDQCIERINYVTVVFSVGMLCGRAAVLGLETPQSLQSLMRN